MSGNKQPRAEPPFIFSVINELRSAACFETFNMIASKDMKKPEQESTCFLNYHGDGVQIMGQAAKFMKGMDVYASLWTTEQTKFGDRKILLERLHQQSGKVLVADDNISEYLIRKTYALKQNKEILTGPTIISKARLALAGAKKMAAMLSDAVKDHVLDKEPGGEYGFPSGRNEDDFDHWLIKRMYNWETRFGPTGKKNGTGAPTVKPNEDEESDKDIDDNEEKGNDGNDAEKSIDSDAKKNIESNGVESEDGDDDELEPRVVFPSDDPPTNSSAADGSMDKDAPNDFLPKGWVLFKTRGPMSFPVQNRLDFFNEDYAGNKKNKKANGRNHFRQVELAEKAKGRDHAYDTPNGTLNAKEVRGVGTENRKFAVRTAQRNALLLNQEYENELVKYTTLLRTLGGQRDHQLNMAEQYTKMGCNEKAMECMEESSRIYEQINDVNESVRNLESKKPSAVASTNENEK